MMKNPKLRSLLILAALVLGIGWATQGVQGWSRDRLGSRVASSARPGDIHMVSSVTCFYCDRARAWFTGYRVPFTECFVERDETCASQYRALMAPGTPVLLVRGKRLVGFDAETVAAALAQ